MKPNVTITSIDSVRAGALVVLHTGKSEPLPALPAAAREHADAFVRAIDAGRSKAEWFCTLEKSPRGVPRHALFDSTTFGGWLPGREKLKATASRAVALCRKHGIADVAFACPAGKEGADFAAAIVEGACIGDFRDRRFKSSPEKREPLKLQLAMDRTGASAMKARLRDLLAMIESVNEARQLVNAPANLLSPAQLAAEARRLARGKSIQCTVLDKKALHRGGYRLIEAVGGGSANPPRLIVARWGPKRAAVREHVVLLGKGICYDTGGLSIKTADSMHRMSGDMAGGAAAIATVHAAAAMKLPVRVTAIVPAAMNDIDADAVKPGAIVTSKIGKTVYIENTDAEGRLVLADGMARAAEEKADVLIDLATLTAAAGQALGQSRAALFTDDEALSSALLAAGEESGELLWRLPLVREYESALNHPLADLNNIASGSKGGGAIHAANFLKAFVPPNVRWAHLDIAPTAYQWSEMPYMAPGATGFGVRLLTTMLRTWCEAGVAK